VLLARAGARANPIKWGKGHHLILFYGERQACSNYPACTLTCRPENTSLTGDPNRTTGKIVMPVPPF
jgi:hypothetical protein